MKSSSQDRLPNWAIGLFALSVAFVTLVSVFLGQSLIVGLMTGIGGVAGVLLTFYLMRPALLDSR